MKILVTNKEKLTSAIKEAEGRASARTETAEHIANVLNNIGVPKKHLHGTKVYFDNAQKFPSSYRYTPESTHWIAENIKGKWYITAIYRAKCPNRQQCGEIEYSDTAKVWVMNEATKLYC